MSDNTLPAPRRRVPINGMNPFAFTLRRLFSLALLAAFPVLSCSLATAPPVFGSTIEALEVGALFGFGAWRVAAYGLPGEA